MIVHREEKEEEAEQGQLLSAVAVSRVTEEIALIFLFFSLANFRLVLQSRRDSHSETKTRPSQG